MLAAFRGRIFEILFPSRRSCGILFQDVRGNWTVWLSSLIIDWFRILNWNLELIGPYFSAFRETEKESEYNLLNKFYYTYMLHKLFVIVILSFQFCSVFWILFFSHNATYSFKWSILFVICLLYNNWYFILNVYSVDARSAQ